MTNKDPSLLSGPGLRKPERRDCIRRFKREVYANQNRNHIRVHNWSISEALHRRNALTRLTRGCGTGRFVSLGFTPL